MEPELLGPGFVLTGGELGPFREIVASKLRVPRLELLPFYFRRVFNALPALEPGLCHRAVSHLLRKLPALNLSIDDKTRLDSVPFLQADNGILKRPDELYARSGDSVLVNLWGKGRGFFPSEVYARDNLDPLLNLLGLRTELTPQAAVACARDIVSAAPADVSGAVARARSLLRFLDSLSATCQDLTPFEPLKTIPWVPVKAPGNWLPARGDLPDTGLAVLGEMCTLGQSWLCSGERFVLASPQPQSQALLSSFRWDTCPSSETVARQLISVARMYVEQPGEDAERADVSAHVAHLAYEALISDRGSAAYERACRALTCADVGCIWLGPGVGFRRPGQIAFKSWPSIPANDVLPVVSFEDEKRYGPLLRDCGVREEVGVGDYVRLLEQTAKRCAASADVSSLTADVGNLGLRNEKGSGNEEGKKPLGRSLTKDELPLCIAAVVAIAELLKAEDKCPPGVLIPTAGAVLHPASTLLFNDVPWEALDLSGGAAAQQFCHENIPPKAAARVGAGSRRLALMQGLEGFGGEVSEGLEGFEQEEPLVVRLRELTEQYPDGVGIVRELVQNAADAGDVSSILRSVSVPVLLCVRLRIS